LFKAGISETKINKLIDDLTTNIVNAELSIQDRAMLSYVEKVTNASDKITQEDVEKLRKVGFDDVAIHDICSIAAYFGFVNRIASGLGVELEERFCDNKV
jgi:uncharacterized peroxidase-related enzyme